MPNQDPAFAKPFGNGPVRVGTQGLLRLCLKTFVAPLLPARLTAPGSPRMVILQPLLTASWLLTASCQSVKEFSRRHHPKGKFLSTDEEGNFSSVFKFINLFWFWSSISLCFGYHCRFGFSSFNRFFIIVRGAFSCKRLVDMIRLMASQGRQGWSYMYLVYTKTVDSIVRAL